MPRDRVVVVGSGVAGLVSAFALAARGLDVTTEAYPYTAGMTGWVPMLQTVLAF